MNVRPHVRPEDHPNKTPLTMPEWLTYAQAGARFGMSADAVRMRARRLGWRTQPGNDGRALVLVPDDIEVQPRERSPERAHEHSAERSPE